jgi:predicted alpha-1,2-mannosidase
MNRRKFLKNAAVVAGVATVGPSRELALAGSAKAETVSALWQIGNSDGSFAEFALAPGDYRRFLQQFGSPDQAYYIGLSKPESAWPYVLPGPLDTWGGSGGNGRWDQMNTLPIGFVLEQAPASGRCVLTIDLCDTDPQHPPRLRVTINGTRFERALAAGGSEDSLRGNLQSAKKQPIQIGFPPSLLRRGYNEISLRSTRGSWLIFDALRLETAGEARLAPVTDTVVRSVSTAPYAVSASKETPATIRVEVFRADSPGKLQAEIANGETQELTTEPGLQVFELPAPASGAGKTTLVRLSAEGQLLHETRLSLRPSPPATPTDYVDVFKGTAHSRWMIAPGPWMPFGMVKLSPDNQTQGWCAGYDYTIEHIDCFSHIHEWTMAGLGMMPTVGPLRTKRGLDGAGYSSRFSKSTERGGIGFYEVFLKDSGIKAELTATTRTALQQYTFPASDQARVIFDFLLPNEYVMHVLGAKVRRTGPAEIEGTVQTDLSRVCENIDQRFNLHFVAQFSCPFETLGGWQGERTIPNVQELALADDCGAFVEFKTAANEKILVRTGISLVSVANARLNLEQELARPFGWDFAAVVANQRRGWDELFNRVEIETPDAREKARFYTNLYRSLSGRNTWSDVNGEWIDPDKRQQKVDDPDAVMLGCDALWTTFWNMNQVMNLLAPEWSARWVKSELQLYDKCGWLAKGPAGLAYIPVMVAEHEIALLVAAYQHGVKGVNGEKALAAAVKMQTALPQLFGTNGAVGNENLENYLKYGYVADDGPVVIGMEGGKAWTSNTLEYAYDDWCVAQLARALGRKDVAETFLKRSESWRNVFDTSTGFARPRKANGEWVTPFDPYHTPGFDEGNAWEYTWFVPQDVPGLVNAMGRDRFVSRLNEAFEIMAPARFNAGVEGMDCPLTHGNQPDMQVAWLFNWAGQPGLTQKWVRAILEAYYGHNPADAYLGDEDQGQMSGWFVMASLGLFQTDGGCRVNPIYELGSPLYQKVVLHLSKPHYGGKTFTIEARNASRTNCYIQSATLNGMPLNQWWIRQKDVVEGGRLVLELGPTPNKEWAKDGPLPG